MHPTRAFFYVYLPIHDSGDIMSLKSLEIVNNHITAHLLQNVNEIVEFLK